MSPEDAPRVGRRDPGAGAGRQEPAAGARSLDLRELGRWATRHRGLVLELFVASNLAFLVVDIYVAHSVNQFREWTEWIPFWYAGGAALLLGANALVTWWRQARKARPDPGDGPDGPRFHQGWGRWLGLILGSAGILVGITGLVLHLESSFFREATLRNLVYSAPFVAPLAFAGLGFLLLLNRMVDHRAEEWGAWVLFLALGGWIGNFGLSLADHAQNGFFYPLEWVPVVASALAVGWLITALLARVERRFLQWGMGLMGIQALVGMAGFWLHVAPVVNETGGTVWNRIVYGAPVFAPLLFADMAVLAALGLWALSEDRASTLPGPPRPPREANMPPSRISGLLLLAGLLLPLQGCDDLVRDDPRESAPPGAPGSDSVRRARDATNPDAGVDPAQFIGGVHPPLPPGVEDLAFSTVRPKEGFAARPWARTRWSFQSIRAGGRRMLWLSEVISRDSTPMMDGDSVIGYSIAPTWRVIDAVPLPAITEEERFSMGNCSTPDDAAATAIVRWDQSVKWMREVRLAWGVDREAGRIVPLDPTLVRCENYGYGYEPG